MPCVCPARTSMCCSALCFDYPIEKARAHTAQCVSVEDAVQRAQPSGRRCRPLAAAPVRRSDQCKDKDMHTLGSLREARHETHRRDTQHDVLR